MFYRNALKELDNWKNDLARKPLVIRGARQIGKTTLIDLFSKNFENMVRLNLEQVRVRKYWEGDPTTEELLRNIEISERVKIIPGKTLLFLDEIQNEPKAIQSLRYFYENHPALHVIATGSLLEVALKNKGFSFPVGRVSFLYLHPVTFDEFLNAIGRKDLVEELVQFSSSTKISPAIDSLCRDLYADYLYLGGMPEVIRVYLEGKSFVPLLPLKEGLLTSFEEDVPKYATAAQVPYIHFLIRQAPLFAGQRIQYNNFANSNYRSREMRHSFETLEMAMVIQRVLGSTQTIPPLQPHLRVSPKLLFLDVGLVGHRLGVELASLKTHNLNDLYRGTLAEQIVGQELLGQNRMRRDPPFFWFRNAPGSTAEIDYCIPIKERILPIEVKSGKTGRLRSLFQFMEQSPHPYAVRIHSGPLQLDSLQSASGKPFQLFSLPFYLAWNLSKVVEKWIMEG